MDLLISVGRADAPLEAPAPPERAPDAHRPVIFLAPARSHSSVVAAMIGSHPECFGFPELCLFDHATVGARLDAPPGIGKTPPGWNPVPGLERAIAELHEGQQNAADIAAARRWLEERRSWSGADVFDHLLRLVAPRIGVEKSPETVNGEDKMWRALNAYPHGRFIHLARHPITAARSTQTHYWLFDHPTHCALGWFNQHRRILDFTARLPADQFILVRSECVLNSPGSELKRIARWIGVSDDRDAICAMRHPELSPFARPAPDVAYGGNDPAFLREPTPRAVEVPPSLAPPPAWKIPLDVWSGVEEVARALGY